MVSTVNTIFLMFMITKVCPNGFISYFLLQQQQQMMMMLTNMMTKNSVPAAAAEATTGMRGKLGCGGSVGTVVGEVVVGPASVCACMCVCVCVCGGGGGVGGGGAC